MIHFPHQLYKISRGKNSLLINALLGTYLLKSIANLLEIVKWATFETIIVPKHKKKQS